MDVGGVGAVGAGISAVGVAGIGAAQGAAGAMPADLAAIGASGQAGLTPQMEALISLLDGFTSAQILLALMVSSGRKSRGKDADDPFAALLAMSFAAQLQKMTQGISQLSCGNVVGAANAGGAVGAQMNVLT